MSKPEFVYVTYIETTPEKLWQALTDGDFTERYWFGAPTEIGLEGRLVVRDAARRRHRLRCRKSRRIPIGRGGWPTPSSTYPTRQE